MKNITTAYKRIIFLFLLIIAVIAAKGQSSYTQEDVFKVSGITTEQQTLGLPLTSKQSKITYYDGLGRPIQRVALQASPLQNDIIQPITYDNLGKQIKSYLPYAGQSADVSGSYRANAISTDQPAFYNNTSQYLIANDVAPYAQQVTEASPLQRVVQSGSVGDNFQPGSGVHYKTISYRANNTGDGNILVWEPNGSQISGNYYAADKLSVTDGTDEDGREILSFSDINGQIILKRQILSGGNLDTYYIYNTAGMLNYVIPPKALALMVANSSYSLGQTGVNKLIFHYEYNDRGQVTERTAPGKGTSLIVYDPLNRPVLTQEANQAASNKWTYTKYDALNRVVSAGIYTDATNTTRALMQAYVTSGTIATNYSSVWYESRSTGSSTGYYTNNVFPTSNITPLSYAYYDDYDIDNNGSDNYSYVSQSLSGETGQTTAPIKSAPTMSSTRTIGSGLSNIWLLKVMFYDKRGNIIQTQSNNQLNYSAGTITDYATMVPDFVGAPQITKVSKTTGISTTITVQTSFTYDHTYRIKSVSQQYNGGSATTVAAYSYNELGQVIKKGLGLVSGTTYLQNVDLRYNIRGQLLSINNSKLANDGGVTNSDSNDLFGMQFLYDQTDSHLSNTPYYNGKLSAVKWMSKDGSGTSSYERAYNYSYDGVDRYTGQTYAERTTASTSNFTVTHGWDESGITYDANGNILTLTRNSSSPGAGTSTQIDDLTYTYDTNNPNQLKNITDGTGSSYTGAGFRNLTGSTGDYSYDSNTGSLTADPYKGITSITYNDLDRTDRLSLSGTQYIDYTYSADGTLIRKQAYKSGTTTQVTDYIDGFVYNNSGGSEVLAYFPMPEGRVRNNSGTLKQEFVIADQQGNSRISFENNGSGTAVVRQENSYYGFGMVLTNSPVATPTDDNKQLYNGGSEWQNDYGNLPDYYQTYYRNYDAAIGRFIAVDLQAESAESMTVYQYAGNNPIIYNDPIGDIFRLTREGAPAMPRLGGEGYEAEILRWSAAIEAASGFSDIGGGGSKDSEESSVSEDKDGVTLSGPIAREFWSDLQLAHSTGKELDFTAPIGTSTTAHATVDGYVILPDVMITNLGATWSGIEKAYNNYWAKNNRSANQGGMQDPETHVDPRSFNLKKIGDAYYVNVMNIDEKYEIRTPTINRDFHYEITVLGIQTRSRNRSGRFLSIAEAQGDLASAYNLATSSVTRLLTIGAIRSDIDARNQFLSIFKVQLLLFFGGQSTARFTQFPGANYSEIVYKINPY